jgi:hypothetical protein
MASGTRRMVAANPVSTVRNRIASIRLAISIPGWGVNRVSKKKKGTPHDKARGCYRETYFE